MVVGRAAAIRRVAVKRLEGDRDFASNMVEERGVWWKVVPGVRKDNSVCVFRMVVVGGVGFMIVKRELREVQCFVRHMVAVNDVCLMIVRRVLRVLRHFVKRMVEGSDVYMKEVGFAQKVFMEELIIVWLTVVERDVWYQVVPRARVGGLIVA